MCIGIPMQVLSADGLIAECCSADEATATEQVDLSLVGPCAPGTWLLVFLGAAREILDEQTARQMALALEALQQTMLGDQNIDHLFADLVDREPPLPDHLKNLVGKPLAVATPVNEGEE